MYDRLSSCKLRTTKNSISNFIIETIANTADGFARVEDFMSHPSLYAYSGGRIIPPKSGFAQALRRLKSHQVLEAVQINGELLFHLIDPQIVSKFKSSKTEEDYWVIIIFDIPEQQRIIRNLLRRGLKAWGFQQIQKSVWGAKKPIYAEVLEMTKNLKITPWVKVIQSSKTNF